MDDTTAPPIKKRRQSVRDADEERPLTDERPDEEGQKGKRKPPKSEEDEITESDKFVIKLKGTSTCKFNSSLYFTLC